MARAYNRVTLEYSLIVSSQDHAYTHLHFGSCLTSMLARQVASAILVGVFIAYNRIA